MKKQLCFPAENRGMIICGANLHHPEYLQGRNATEKIMVSQILQASHIFPSLKKEMLCH